MFILFVTLLPKLKAIDGILPQNVAPWANRWQRIEIGIGYPNGKRRVFLTQGLPRLHGGSKEVSYVATHRKLHQAEHETCSSNGEYETCRRARIDDIFNRCASNYGKRAAPQIKWQIVNAQNHVLNTRQ